MTISLNIPRVATYGIIATDRLQTSMGMRHPQIIQHTAFIPVVTENVDVSITDTLKLIEECKLEQDILVKDTTGDYSTAVYANRTQDVVIVPPGTHMKGGKQNRGNNRVEILGADARDEFSVNCFEPSRGSGGDNFTSIEDAPADVVRDTMTNTHGYEGTWPIIAEYTRMVGRSGALTAFLEKTEVDRAKYALNFETCDGQTGVAVITKGLSMIEVFPTPTVFNIYRPRILRGKVASLFYRLQKASPDMVILPTEIDIKLKEMVDYVQKAVEITIDQGVEKNGLLVGRHRDGSKAMDVVLKQASFDTRYQVAYLFGIW